MLVDARAALRSSRFTFRGLPELECIEWITKYKYQLRNQSSVPEIHSSSDAISLWQVHRDVKFIARLFVQDKLPVLSGLEALQQPQQPDQREYTLEDLSDSEKLRLFRSIYRYAIYGDLFYYDIERPKTKKMSYISAYEQAHTFLILFPAWQVEELSCINDFMQDKILEKWQETEDTEFESIANDPSSWDMDRSNRSDSRWEDDFFSHPIKVGYYQEWQQYFATLTLQDLRSVFTAKDKELQSIVKKRAWYGIWDCLANALGEEPYDAVFITPKFEEYEQAIASGMKMGFQKDSITNPNHAWLWAHDYQPCELYVEASQRFPIGEGLRRFGYVFWDSKRLHDSGILQKLPAEVSKVALASFPRPMFSEKSVEDRIRELWQQTQQVSAS